MALVNLYSLGHFALWSVVGRFISTNWYLFFAVSLGWEILELYLPYDFAIETIDNKIADVVVNTLAFWLGTRIRHESLDF